MLRLVLRLVLKTLLALHCWRLVSWLQEPNLALPRHHVSGRGGAGIEIQHFTFQPTDKKKTCKKKTLFKGRLKSAHPWPCKYTARAA